MAVYSLATQFCREVHEIHVVAGRRSNLDTEELPNRGHKYAKDGENRSSLGFARCWCPVAGGNDDNMLAAAGFANPSKNSSSQSKPMPAKLV
jgi:hypothetical protein